ncbi:hypothetical protein EDB86DRAFT_3023860 [Lactarius hatsudake]|nr:hypothetical protein EDB86DRAFT_3023860 [Lactarius hatsudake]
MYLTLTFWLVNSSLVVLLPLSRTACSSRKLGPTAGTRRTTLLVISPRLAASDGIATRLALVSPIHARSCLRPFVIAPAAAVANASGSAPLPLPSVILRDPLRLRTHTDSAPYNGTQDSSQVPTGPGPRTQARGRRLYPSPHGEPSTPSLHVTPIMMPPIATPSKCRVQAPMTCKNPAARPRGNSRKAVTTTTR